MSNLWFRKFEDGKPIGNLIAYNNLMSILHSYMDISNINGSPDFYEGQGYAMMTMSDKPTLTVLQDAVEIDSIKIEDGTWQQRWTVVSKTAAEIKKLTDEQAARVAEMRQHKIDVVDDFLPQMEYADVVDELSAYKAALQAVDLSDPFNVNWPTPPSEDTGIMLPY
jgi:hypothetical protein